MDRSSDTIAWVIARLNRVVEPLQRFEDLFLARDRGLALTQQPAQPADARTRDLALRISPTYVGTFYKLDPLDPAPNPHGSIQNNVGLNIGIVYRFGHIK